MKIIRAAALLLIFYIPALAFLFGAYVYFAPRQYCASIEIRVRPNIVSKAELQEALREAARPYGDSVVLRTLSQPSWGDPWPSSTVDSYSLEIAAFDSTPWQALNKANKVAYVLNNKWLENMSAGVLTYEWFAEPPLAQARRSLSRALLVGACVGLCFAVAGVVILYRSARGAGGTTSPSQHFLV
jgi:hypothetical protein